MNELVKLTRLEDIAVVTIDNPPVNALSPGVPEGILRFHPSRGAGPGGESHCGDRRRLYLHCRRGYPGISKDDCRREAARDAPPALLAIEDSPKPVVMAIHGQALGGGLEVAMAGHYRVIAPSAQVGQPEVKLGIIPGAGGTQRLPRLAGVAKARRDVRVRRAHLGARGARARGSWTASSKATCWPGAVAFAREVAEQAGTAKHASATKSSAPSIRPIFAAARDTARKTRRGQPAPLAAIDAVEASTRLPFEEGCKLEAKLFNECLFSTQSKALIHAFFGERAVNKIPDIPKGTTVIRDPARRRDRRGHHGRRHRHELRQRRHSGDR